MNAQVLARSRERLESLIAGAIIIATSRRPSLCRCRPPETTRGSADLRGANPRR